MTYKEQLLNPRWQKKRLEIFERDHWTCQSCFEKEKTLHVHHMCYLSILAWEYDNYALITVCANCHKKLHSKNSSEVTQVYLKLYFTIWHKENYQDV